MLFKVMTTHKKYQFIANFGEWTKGAILTIEVDASGAPILQSVRKMLKSGLIVEIVTSEALNIDAIDKPAETSNFKHKKGKSNGDNQ